MLAFLAKSCDVQPSHQNFTINQYISQLLTYRDCYQCVKLTVTTSPLATKNCPPATYFEIPGAILGPTAKKRRSNNNWAEGQVWLQHDKDNNVMFCEWCRRFDKNKHRNQFVKGCTLMKLESVKKHEQSRQHRDSEADRT